ncbi:5-methylcytosine-specific restriction endonuclease McrA [Sphingomonas kaistensis]|uniref:Putative HNH nuclease YajD n=1 Tax=Sphingomonas kaistensis TaxID=298708 RepID=A0A7X5Y7H2_9SPHN|nr:HNH endonuclease [Sphingomonas kaistensis]NJC06529.1 5-methylcytosine-specific restriction endonuclease McrA [Sphingomonas kaistensis]
MRKLTNLKPRILPSPGRLTYLQGAADSGELGMKTKRADKARYNTSRWRKLRWSILLRDRFTCQMCGRVEVVTSLLVADHKQPHRGSERLFWDENNLQTLCKSPCHDKHKQAQEASGYGG